MEEQIVFFSAQFLLVKARNTYVCFRGHFIVLKPPMLRVTHVGPFKKVDTRFEPGKTEGKGLELLFSFQRSKCDFVT